METELIKEIKKHLIPLELELEKAMTKYKNGYLNEKQLDRAANVEGWVSDLNLVLETLELDKKLTFLQVERLKYLMDKK